jgi:hypothetical protein
MSNEQNDKPGSSQSVNTAGGTFVGGGDSNIGNTSVQGDLVQGDKVAGDKVLGDKITVGDIIGSSGVAIGRNASATVTTGLSATDAAQLFNAIYAKIEARPADPNIGKDEIKETVQRIQQEASAGDQANESKLRRWLMFLAGIAPDIFDVTVATLASPAAGFGMIAKKIAERAKAEQVARRLPAE